MANLFEVGIFLITILLGGFGFVCSIFSLYLIIKKPFLHNAYGYICAASSAFEGSILFIFIVWTTAIVFVNKDLEKSAIGVIFGFIVNFIYYNAQYLHLLKSINRFIAIVFFVKYRIFFTTTITKILISIITLMGFAHICPYFSYYCNYYFDSKTFVWQTRDLDCIIPFYVDISSVSLTMTISLSCDFITFCYLHFSIHKKSSSLKNDIRFLIQAFLTSLLYLTMIISFHVFSRLVDGIFMGFITTTFAWMLCHSLNQFSFILFTLWVKGKTSNKIVVVNAVSTVNVRSTYQ